MRKKSGCGMNIPDHISESLETIGLKILKFSCGYGSGIRNLLDHGCGIWKKHSGSAMVMPIANTDH
jgi:hypothetical protein